MKKKAIAKTVGKIALIIGVVAVIAVSAFFILRACGFTTKEDFLRLRDDLGDSIAFWAVIVALQVIQVVFIPISNSLISAPVALIFNNELWKVFLSSWIGICIGTIILYFIGRSAGGKLLNFVLGDKEKAEKLKEFMKCGKSFFVIGDLCPLIPNDVLTVLAGMSDYTFTFTFFVTLITRAICIATTVYLFGYITTYPWLIAVLIVVMAIMFLIAIKLTRGSLRRGKLRGKTLNQCVPIDTNLKSTKEAEVSTDNNLSKLNHIKPVAQSPVIPTNDKKTPN